MQKSKLYGMVLLGVTLLGLAATALLMWVFDPYFHFHAPFEGVSYVLNNERYQNNGITRQFEYDALITGTSMTQNFKTSELDALFGTNSIKIPYAGASFKELNDAVVAAKEYNPALTLVVRGLDLYQFEEDKDYLAYDSYPTYLYDDNLLNDAQYLWNKDILTTDFLSLSLIPTLTGAASTTFDAYSNWMSENTFGKETVLASYNRAQQDDTAAQTHLSEADQQTIYDNVMQNVVQVAIDNPDMTFYYFLPPYSIVYFDDCNQNNALYYELEKLEYAASLLVEYDNIQLYAFFEEYDLVTNLDNYKDWTHYSEDVNSMILEAMAAGEHQLTAENYQSYFAELTDYYTSYDYEAIFAA
ncbi:MAG: hypothetical protein R3Y06_07790 [Faecalibacterium sp.]